MAATPYFHQRLPPSPPPSPPRHRHAHHKKEHSDPFFDLDRDSVENLARIESPLSSPQNSAQEEEGLITRIIFTPLYFTSFLISLFLVNASDRRHRYTEHSPPSKWSNLLPMIWNDPEPYQDPDNSTWERRGSTTHAEPHGALNPDARRRKEKKKESWHLNKKIGEMAKLEISDAFEMRGRVAVVIVAAVLVTASGVVLVLRWMVHQMWR